MRVLFIINDAPYGTERAYNALRLAIALQKDESIACEVRVFLLADAVTAALPMQGTPQGYYNIERMLKAVIGKGGEVKACGTCCEARGLKNVTLVPGIKVSTMAELAAWTVAADKVLVF